MTDIFREIEEDLRRDRFSRIWQRHGHLLVGLVVVIVVAVAGWRYWTYSQETAAAAAGVRFDEAIKLAENDTSGDAEKALEAVVSGAPAGYRTLARFRLAAEIGQRDAAAGAAAFDALASDQGVADTLKGLARLRAAMLLVDRAEPKEIASRIEGLAGAGSPWRHTARELLGLAALKAGDYDAAGRWFDQLAVDPETPSSLRQRSQLYLALVRAGPVTPATQ